ncbi:unnamed protein product [Paramecium sonneborni]|uniref:Uncharacterized protein n=1 Tax=Paramecium sonneborni TaxID=65129 RepID=A0A8S1LAZ8_9CILI|nr:unnamed protein product [Paramecium sonneborni]
MKDGIFDDFNDKEHIFEFTKGNQTYIRDIGTITDYKVKNQGTTTKKDGQDFEQQIDQNELQQTKGNLYIIQVDQNKLSQFLKRVLPTVIKELDESQNLKKYHSYKPLSDIQRKETELVYILTNQQNKSIELERKLEITDIQWNSNGLIIAASYGCLDHLGQCSHTSYINCWNIFKRDFKPDKPTIVIETNTCNMCMQFHPTNPNILAVGSFNGELYLYDISTNSELAHSTIDEYYHRESITAILWLQDESIMTLGCEGKVLIWNPERGSAEFHLQNPLKGCYLVRKKESQTESVGGVCIAQSNEDPFSFIVGSEGGSVLRAQITPINYTMTKQTYLDSRDKGLIWKEETILFMQNLNQKCLPEIKLHVENYCKERKINNIFIQQLVNSKPDIRKMYANPINYAYEAHYGTVFSINFSPFVKSAFITASMDGQIRLYLQNTARCLAVYEYIQTYILSAQFSPTRPCVFAACDSTGQILIFDLMQDTQQQVVTLKNDGQSAACLRFNQRQQDLLACSYQGCEVRIFQLNDELTQPKENELKELQQLLT